LYGGIAAVLSGLQPVLSWKDVTAAMHWWITDEQMEAACGKPVDPAYWESAFQERAFATGVNVCQEERQ